MTAEKIRELLEKRSLLITLVLAIFVIVPLGTQVVSENVMPYTDGNHYVQRILALHGFLHSGQWGKFWNLFTLPRQTLAPPQYFLFLLLPSAWASLASYGFLTLVCNFGFLAVAIWNLCRVFERREWAPALFLLCACENYSFDYPFFFFLDLTFGAFTTLAISFQVEAWKKPMPRAGLLAGAGLGLLFWIKPANALLFAGMFLFSEIIRGAWLLYRKEKVQWVQAAWLLSGFLPVFLAAIGCGALQSIALLFDRNELSPEWETHLPITGLLRLFYFPFCFAYFYNVLVVAVIVALLVCAFYFLRDQTRSEPRPFPTTALIMLILIYTVFGEIFSFWILVKTMRSLVFLLPLLWLFVFWLADLWRVRAPLLLFGAALYALVLLYQVKFDVFQSKPLSPDKFFLTDNWFESFPMAWGHYESGPRLVDQLQQQIVRALPQGGRVGVSTERVFLDGRSLSLRLNGADLLAGCEPRYSCIRLFNRDGRYSPTAFLSANGIILYVAKNAQYSQFTWRETTNLLAVIPGRWAAAQDIMPVQSGNEFLGYMIPLRVPLTRTRLEDAMHQAGAPGPMLDDRLDEYIYGERYSRAELVDLVRRWLRKRFD